MFSCWFHLVLNIFSKVEYYIHLIPLEKNMYILWFNFSNTYYMSTWNGDKIFLIKLTCLVRPGAESPDANQHQLFYTSLLKGFEIQKTCYRRSSTGSSNIIVLESLTLYIILLLLIGGSFWSLMWSHLRSYVNTLKNREILEILIKIRNICHWICYLSNKLLTSVIIKIN